MKKTELLAKGIEMDREEQLIKEQKTLYINTLLKKEELLIKQFSEFFNTFLTDDVFEIIKKINHPTECDDDYVWINTPLIRLHYYYKWCKIKINVENDRNIIPLTSICDIRIGNFPIIGTKWISSNPSETSAHFIKQKADQLKAFEKMYDDFKENIQTFYNKVCDRRNHKIEEQQKFLSSLPQFNLEEEAPKLYRIKITLEEIQ